MILKATRESLEELAADKDIPMQGVWYGACRAKSLAEWNYFVFRRGNTTKSSNKVDMQTTYKVSIIHEDYIPEGYVQNVIAKLEAQSQSCAGAKLKATSDPIDYNYTFKGNTDVVVEIATITFVHPEKRDR